MTTAIPVSRLCRLLGCYCLLFTLLIPFEAYGQTDQEAFEVRRRAVLRANPSSRADAILRLEPGELVTRTRSRMRNNYVQVETTNQMTGWVWSKSLVSVTASGLGDSLFEPNASLPDRSEVRFLEHLNDLILEMSDLSENEEDPSWTLRSQHFIFGMPHLIDNRHSFAPLGFGAQQPGVSIMVREAFAVAHFDRMKAPLWVTQQWTRFDRKRLDQVPAQKDRPWRVDLDVPEYGQGGTEYAGSITQLDRGHMARHEMNRAWGVDSSNWGSRMSNSAPQHKSINQHGTWRKLEDEIRDVVIQPGLGIEAIWTISGTIYRDKENPPDESPEQDFENAVRLESGGFGVPDATYKIVAWFDRNQDFQARAYVFEQPHSLQERDGKQVLIYDLGETKAPLTDYLVSINSIEARTGVDFFPVLRPDIEDRVESRIPQDIWGDQPS